ncbi:hypothetical protein P691DRAFT_790872 [Macrolepiota fuliginosa MF-IS2]|uniref:G domain-containing protein n=1 Tax=Macrolepiota fuliginosa MF-IS2 TaxID=1400762 RepID=A0A9P6C5S9_9AGAR|nr:hypothetical protein P691DRAFT_790872 [Macrolepiota fuliginosa MF-IS2]
MFNKFLKGLSFDHKNIWKSLLTCDYSVFRLFPKILRKSGTGSDQNSPGDCQRKPFEERANFHDLIVDVIERKDLTKDDIIIASDRRWKKHGQYKEIGSPPQFRDTTGLQGGVGHNLEPCTSGVTAIRVTFMDGIRVVLVDTPGFDDTYRSDLDILELVSRWLKKTYEDGIELAGILYLHRITDNRMAGTSLKNLDMFLQLCGEGAFEKVVISTTMWQDLNEIVGNARETELMQDYWMEMIKRGSRTVRFMNNQQSAWNILNLFAT